MIPLLLPTLSLVSALFKVVPSRQWVQEEREVFHGIKARVVFEVSPDRTVGSGTLLDRAWAEFDRVARVANAFDPDSEVGRLNAAFKAGSVQVSGELADLLEQSLWASQITDGAFDVTVWPLKRLWREAAERGRPPDSSELREVLARVGWSHIRLQQGKEVVFDRPDVAMDFGGIAKGWAVDRVAALLESAGVRSYLVQCGGEIAVLGRSPRKEPWAVGVQDPLRPGEALGVISGPERMSVSTSGPAEQPLRVGDRLVHHILDPRTGKPAPLLELGVTVVIVGDAPRTARADALATALSVLGPGRGLDVLKTVPGAHALWIEPGEDGRYRLNPSPGFATFFTPVAQGIIPPEPPKPEKPEPQVPRRLEVPRGEPERPEQDGGVVFLVRDQVIQAKEAHVPVRDGRLLEGRFGDPPATDRGKSSPREEPGG